MPSWAGTARPAECNSRCSMAALSTASRWEEAAVDAADVTVEVARCRCLQFPAEVPSAAIQRRRPAARSLPARHRDAAAALDEDWVEERRPREMEKMREQDRVDSEEDLDAAGETTGEAEVPVPLAG